MLTLAQLRNMVLFWLDDLNGTYFTSVQANQWLNNAYFEVQKQLIAAGQFWYATPVTTSTIANQENYALPSDFFQCHRIELLTQGSLTGSAANQTWSPLENQSLVENTWLNNFGTGQPTVYTIVKNCLYLKTIPDQAYVLRMFYSYVISPMVNDLNIPDVPAQFQEYIALLATMDGFIKDQRDPSPLLAKKDYYLALMKQTDIQRDRSQPRRVRRTMDDGSWMGF